MAFKRKLFSVTIKDCRVESFTVGGHGGSGKDTSNTGIRVTHEPSGAVGKATDTRSYAQNRELAFTRMGKSKEFQTWAKLRASELQTGKSIEDKVEEALHPKNLKIEYRADKGWRVER